MNISYKKQIFSISNWNSIYAIIKKNFTIQIKKSCLTVFCSLLPLTIILTITIIFLLLSNKVKDIQDLNNETIKISNENDILLSNLKVNTQNIYLIGDNNSELNKSFLSFYEKHFPSHKKIDFLPFFTKDVNAYIQDKINDDDEFLILKMNKNNNDISFIVSWNGIYNLNYILLKYKLFYGNDNSIQYKKYQDILLLLLAYKMKEQDIHLNKSLYLESSFNLQPKLNLYDNTYFLLFTYSLGIVWSFLGVPIISIIQEDLDTGIYQSMRRQGMRRVFYLLGIFISRFILFIPSVIGFILIVFTFSIKGKSFLIIYFLLFFFSFSSFFALLGINLKSEKLPARIFSLIIIILILISTLYSSSDIRFKFIFYFFPTGLFVDFVFLLSVHYMADISLFNNYQLVINNTSLTIITIILIVQIGFYLILCYSSFVVRENQKFMFLNKIKTCFTSLFKEKSLEFSNKKSNKSNNKGNNTEKINLYDDLKYVSFHQTTDNHQEVEGDYLKIEEINCRYKNKDIVIDDLSLNLYKNKIYCLYGDNGEGKSTLLKLISREVGYDKGKIEYNRVIFEENSNYNYKIVSLIKKENDFLPYLNVNEHIDIYTTITGKNNVYINENELSIDQYIDWLLDSLSLDRTILYKLVSELNDDLKRKVNILLNMVSNPEIVLFDEPTSEITSENIKLDIWKFIKTIKTERIVLVCTKSMEEMEMIGEEVGIIKNGEIICSGDLDYIRKCFNLKYIVSFIIKPNKIREVKSILIDEIRKLSSKIDVLTNKEVYNNKISYYCSEDDVEKLIDYYNNHKNEFYIEYYLISSPNIKDFFDLNNQSLQVNKHNNNSTISLDTQENILNIMSILEENSLNSHLVEGEEGTNNDTNLNNSFINTFKKEFKRHLLREYRNKLYFIMTFTICIFLSIFSSFFISNVINEEVDSSQIINSSLNYIQISTNPKSDIDYFNGISNINTVFEYGYNSSIASFRNYIYEYYPNHDNHFSILYDNHDEKELKVKSTSSENILMRMTIESNILSEYIRKEASLEVFDIIETFYVMNTSIDYSIGNYIFSFLYIKYIIIVSSVSLNNLTNERSSEIYMYIKYSKENTFAYYTVYILIDMIKFTILNLLSIPTYSQLYEDDTYRIVCIIFSLCLYSILYSILLLKFIPRIKSPLGLYLITIFLINTVILIVNSLVQLIFPWFDFNFLFPFMEITYFMKYFIYNRKSNSMFKEVLYYRSLLVIVVHCLLLIVVLFLKEYRILNKIKKHYKRVTNSNSTDNTNDYKLKISKAFKSEGEKILLKDFNLRLKNGEKIGLVGDDDHGKTSLMKVIIGEDFLDEGDIEVETGRGRGIGYCPNENILFEDLTVKEHIDYYFILQSSKDKRKEYINSLLEYFSLNECSNKETKELTIENKQKLVFLLSILNKNSIYLLDNPTHNLHDISKRQIREYIQGNLIKSREKQKEETVIIINTNSLLEAELLCDEVYLFSNGCIESLNDLKSKSVSSSSLLYMCFSIRKEVYISGRSLLNEVRSWFKEKGLIIVSLNQLYEFENYIKVEVGVEEGWLSEFILNVCLSINMINKKSIDVDVYEERFSHIYFSMSGLC